MLIIDDDKELCALIKQSVAAENIDADCGSSGVDGLIMLEKNDYQLILLDVMMPGMDGFQTMEKIRQQSSIPILMLTSKNDSISKVRGLRSGADDYLTKPFDMDELIARVVSLIRRYTRFNLKGEHSHPMTYQGLTIDLDSRSVTTLTGTFELPPKEFDLLLFCAKNQGRILTKQQIYEEVWGESYAYDDSNIMAIISRLRKKIEPESGTPFYIQTVKGIGYRFNKGV
jgi:DNA-binding response OmpR family regulator